MTGWVLITGASSGIGEALARMAAKDGYELVISARSQAKLEALAKELRQGGTQVVVVPADLNNLAEVDRLWETASSDGREISILVNNAGLGSHGTFSDADTWDQELSEINVNMLALTQLMKRALPAMRANGSGRILNVASTAAFLPGPNMAVYHATKSYVLSLSESVAEELSGTGVSVTALCPGATATNFFDTADMHGVTLLKFAKPASVESVASAGWTGTLRGKRIVTPGLMNKVFAFIPRISPRRVVSFVMRAVWAK